MKSFRLLAFLALAVLASAHRRKGPNRINRPGAAGADATPVTQDPAPANPPVTGEGTTGGVDVNLIPDFGVTAGVNPDGTGNCQGVNNILIPCSCPPPRDLFVNDLIQNVQAGHAINNTAVAGLTFPNGADKGSVLARLNTATVTLQNLFGAGVGCPQAATTFGAQAAAAQALPN
ncbi:hypothetical protein T439DRAFT_352411 [Meredithblackwellia eburnea MCA 4105]